MKLIYFISLFFLIANPVIAEDECIFDLETQETALLELQKLYKGSKVTLGEKKLELQRENGTVMYVRGGCLHFAESITYSTTEDSNFLTKVDLFNHVVKITNEFFRDFVSGSDIKTALQSGKYKFFKLSHGDYYLIEHKNISITSLELFYTKEGEKHVVRIGYYVK